MQEPLFVDIEAQGPGLRAIGVTLGDLLQGRQIEALQRFTLSAALGPQAHRAGKPQTRVRRPIVAVLGTATIDVRQQATAEEGQGPA